MYALKPDERTFYRQMLAIQWIAEDARIRLPLIDLSRTDNTDDFYRQAFHTTVEIFGISEAEIVKKADLYTSNITTWKKGRRELSVNSLAKLKSCMTPHQRQFMEALVEALMAVNPIKPRLAAEIHR